MIETASLIPAPADGPKDELASRPTSAQDLLRTIDGRLMVLRCRVIDQSDRAHPKGGQSRVALLSVADGRLYLDLQFFRGDVGEPDVVETLEVADIADAAKALEDFGAPARTVKGDGPRTAEAALAAYGDRARWEAYRADFDGWLGDILSRWSQAASAA